MSHNHNMLTALDNLPQCMGFDSCFYTGVLLYLLAVTAIVDNIFTLFDYHLVAAPAQCQVDCHTGIFIILIISITADTDSDT